MPTTAGRGFHSRTLRQNQKAGQRRPSLKWLISYENLVAGWIYIAAGTAAIGISTKVK